MPVLTQKWTTQWDIPGDSYKVYTNTPDFRTIISCNWTRFSTGDTDREVTIKVERYSSNTTEIRISFYFEDDFDPEYKIFPYSANILLISHWVALLAERLTELLEHVDNYDSRVEIALSTKKSKKEAQAPDYPW